MWRIQVWEGKHIAEALLVDTESEAIEKRDELRGTYVVPQFDIKIEELTERSTHVMHPLLAHFLVAILNPFNFNW